MVDISNGVNMDNDALKAYLLNNKKYLVDQDEMALIVDILKDARFAINKINAERNRGIGYRHAEVEWLLARNEQIVDVLKEWE